MYDVKNKNRVKPVKGQTFITSVKMEEK